MNTDSERRQGYVTNQQLSVMYALGT